MQFAPVANLPVYEELLQRNLLGSYQLLIASEVVKDVGAWSEFWSYPHIPEELGKDMFIIMDNGLIETGAALDPQTLKDAADAVDASCIVLPDVLSDCAKTIKVAGAAMPEMSKLGYPLMGVIQARNWDEFAIITDFYRRMNVAYLSVPRVMVENFGTRTQLVRRLQWMKLPIHLLGFSNNLFDDIFSAQMPGVMGIDSAMPLWYEGFLPPTPPVNMDVGRRPKGYWSMSTDNVNFRNVERVRSWLSDVRAARTPEEQQGQEDQLTLPSV